MARSNPWEGLTYRPIPSPDRAVRDLFGFVGAWAPPDSAVDSGWGAWAGDRLVGALLLEKSGSAGMLHGPVVVAPDGEAPPAEPASEVEADRGEALEVAAHLLADALERAGTRGIDTLFTRPQGLDPVWVRLGLHSRSRGRASGRPARPSGCGLVRLARRQRALEHREPHRRPGGPPQALTAPRPTSSPHVISPTSSAPRHQMEPPPGRHAEVFRHCARPARVTSPPRA